MVRRLASQVHKTASRLKGAKLIPEPAWFQAVLQHPPLPVPPRTPPTRTGFDSSDSNPLQTRPKAQSVVYLEDRVRRQFFQDHPFEAYRTRSLVENKYVQRQHPVGGSKWTRLSQRGPNPEPEDVVLFTANLHEQHRMPLALAYEQAVAQFHSLKSEHHLATLFAVHEAEYFGAEFGSRQTDDSFQRELAELKTWGAEQMLDDAAALAARKRWRATPPKMSEEGVWTRGEEYIRLWQAGIRPNYIPVAEDVANPAGAGSGKWKERSGLYFHNK